MKSSCKKSKDARNFDPDLGQVPDIPIVNQRIDNSLSKTPDPEVPSHPNDIETDDPIESRNNGQSPPSMMSCIQWVTENQNLIREENPECTVANFLKILRENWKMKEDPEKLFLKISYAPTPSTITAEIDDNFSKNAHQKQLSGPENIEISQQSFDRSLKNRHKRFIKEEPEKLLLKPSDTPTSSKSTSGIECFPSKTPDPEGPLHPDDIEIDEPIGSRIDIIIENVVKGQSIVEIEESPDDIILGKNLNGLTPLSMMSYNQWTMENQHRLREENPDCTVASFLQILWENWNKLTEEDPEKLILKTSDAPTPTPSTSTGTPKPILIPERLPKISSYMRAFELWCIENRGKISEGDLMTKWMALSLSEKLKKYDQGLTEANKQASLGNREKSLKTAERPQTNRPQKGSSFITAFEFWCIEHRDKIREEDLKTEWNTLPLKEKAKMYGKSHRMRKRVHFQNEEKPFLCYCAYLHDTYKERNEGMNDDELKNLMREDWNALSEKVQQPYRDASKKLENTRFDDVPKPIKDPKRAPKSSASANNPKKVRKTMDEESKMKKAESSDVFRVYAVLKKEDLVRNGENIDNAEILRSWMQISIRESNNFHTRMWYMRKRHGMDSSVPILEMLGLMKHPLLSIPLFPNENIGDISEEDHENKWNAQPEEERKRLIKGNFKAKKGTKADFFRAYTVLKKEELVKNGQIIDKEGIFQSWTQISMKERMRVHKKLDTMRRQFGMDSSAPISEVLAKKKHPLLSIPGFLNADMDEEGLEEKWNALDEEERKQHGKKYEGIEFFCKMKYGKYTKMYNSTPSNPGRFKVFLEMEKEKFGDKFDETVACRSWKTMSKEEKLPYTLRANVLRKREKKRQEETRKAARNLNESKKQKWGISVEEEDEDVELELEKEEYEEIMEDDYFIFDEVEENVQFEPSYEREYYEELVQETSSAAIEDPADIPLYF